MNLMIAACMSVFLLQVQRSKYLQEGQASLWLTKRSALVCPLGFARPANRGPLPRFFLSDLDVMAHAESWAYPIPILTPMVGALIRQGPNASDSDGKGP